MNGGFIHRVVKHSIIAFYLFNRLFNHLGLKLYVLKVLSAFEKHKEEEK